MKKRYMLVALLVACGWAPAANAGELEVGKVVIAVVQTGQEGAAGNDYVALYNNGDQAVTITGWRLQYRAAGATGTSGWVTKRTFACIDQPTGCAVVLPAGGTIVAGTYTPTGTSVQPLTSGFSDIGGQLRVVRPLSGTQMTTVDMVGYGTAAEAEGSATAAPSPGRVIIRSQVDGQLADTNSNAADFTVGCYDPSVSGVPTAISCDPSEELEEEGDETATQTTHSEDQAASGSALAYAKLTITELFPDPISPATDTADEFIEIYNPGSIPVDLTGYTLQSGSDFNDSYTFGSMTVPAGGYITVFSSVSHLGLTNSGSAVQLLDPSGVPIDTVASYGQAKSGKAWAKHAGGDWRWTNPTPGALNTFPTDTTPAVLAAATAVVKKVAAAKKTAAAIKPKAVKPPAAAKAAAKTPSISTSSTATQENSPVPYLILGVVGMGVVGYAAYEYRQDIVRLIRRTKSVVSARKNRAPEPTLQMD